METSPMILYIAYVSLKVIICQYLMKELMKISYNDIKHLIANVGFEIWNNVEWEGTQ